MDDYLKVGVITQTHGIRGEVKIFPTTDDVNRFKKLKEVNMLFKGNYIPLNIESVKFFKQYVILKFKEFSNINEVEMYKNSELYVDREHAVKLSKNEFFIADLIGLKVRSDDGIYEGVLQDVLSTGANDVYEVLLNDDRTVLLPAIKECILNVNVDEEIIIFHMMEGLID